MLIEDDSKIFGPSSIGFLPPNWLVCDSYQGAVGKPYVQDSRRQQQSPLCSGYFASGIPQGRHLQMPGRSWRAGQPSGDGKPVGPDRPLEN